jgi:hypothetical protein
LAEAAYSDSDASREIEAFVAGGIDPIALLV